MRTNLLFVRSEQNAKLYCLTAYLNPWKGSRLDEFVRVLRMIRKADCIRLLSDQEFRISYSLSF